MGASVAFFLVLAKVCNGDAETRSERIASNVSNIDIAVTQIKAGEATWK